jgi:hypothetical protein
LEAGGKRRVPNLAINTGAPQGVGQDRYKRFSYGTTHEEGLAYHFAQKVTF